MMLWRRVPIGAKGLEVSGAGIAMRPRLGQRAPGWNTGYVHIAESRVHVLNPAAPQEGPPVLSLVT